jgi:hypothetical protein
MGGFFQGWRAPWVGECWAGGEGDCEAYGDHSWEVTRAVGGRGKVYDVWIQRGGFAREQQNVLDGVVLCMEETEGFFDGREIRGTAAEDGAGCGTEYYVDGWDWRYWTRRNRGGRLAMASVMRIRPCCPNGRKRWG